MAAAKKNAGKDGRIAENRKARHDYTITDEVEAGLVLLGTEVKSLRAGRASISDAYAAERNGMLCLFNMNIQEYEGGNRFNHDPRRPRELLLHKREMGKLLGKIRTKGVTIVPLTLYFNARGYAKVKLGLAEGKKQYEKREDIKKRDWQREQSRLMKNK